MPWKRHTQDQIIGKLHLPAAEMGPPVRRSRCSVQCARFAEMNFIRTDYRDDGDVLA